MNRPFRGTLICMKELRGWIKHKIDQEFDGENRPDYIKALQDCIYWVQMSGEIDPVKAACGGFYCRECTHADPLVTEGYI